MCRWRRLSYTEFKPEGIHHAERKDTIFSVFGWLIYSTFTNVNVFILYIYTVVTLWFMERQQSRVMHWRHVWGNTGRQSSRQKEAAVDKTEQDCTHAPFSQSRKNYQNLKGSAHSHVSTSRNWNREEEIGQHTTTHHYPPPLSGVIGSASPSVTRATVSYHHSILGATGAQRGCAAQRGGKEGEAACQCKCSCK